MGFVQLLKSLDELLYEVMSWLIFYPVTLWRTLRHPWRMMEYADTELEDRPGQQYTDTLSPPLFLFLSLLLSHGIELAVVGESPLIASTRRLSGLITDDTNLLMLRMVFFSVFPLVMAAHLVRKQRGGLDRETLKAPFYSQCYVAGPFALVMGLAGIFIRLPWLSCQVGALVIGAVALTWYGVLQTRWFALHLPSSLLQGWWSANVGMIESIALVTIVTALFA